MPFMTREQMDQADRLKRQNDDLARFYRSQSNVKAPKSSPPKPCQPRRLHPLSRAWLWVRRRIF